MYIYNRIALKRLTHARMGWLRYHYSSTQATSRKLNISALQSAIADYCNICVEACNTDMRSVASISETGRPDLLYT